MGCPTNLCRRVNMVVDSQGIMKDNKDLVKNYYAEPLPTLIGKPERITALNEKIKEDEAKLTSILEPGDGEAEGTIPDNSTSGEGEDNGEEPNPVE